MVNEMKTIKNTHETEERIHFLTRVQELKIKMPDSLKIIFWQDFYDPISGDVFTMDVVNEPDIFPFFDQNIWLRDVLDCLENRIKKDNTRLPILYDFAVRCYKHESSRLWVLGELAAIGRNVGYHDYI